MPSSGDDSEPAPGRSHPAGRGPPDGEGDAGSDHDPEGDPTESDRRRRQDDGQPAPNAGRRVGVEGHDGRPTDGGAGHRPERPLPPHRRPGQSGGGRPSSVAGWVRWFLTVREGWPVFIREVLSSVLAVLLVGVLLFAVSGVWPPMVAVESGSMEPHMYRGDLVFIMEEHRLAPDAAHDRTGVVTFEAGRTADYTRFGSYGDVIVFDSPSSGGPPIIHRARFWVDQGENWYDRADPAYLAGDDCTAVPNCPAPNAGFITRGDANPTYDQVSGIAPPVRPAWITGTAEVRIPWLGYIRLEFSELSIESFNHDRPSDATTWGPAGHGPATG